MPVDRATSPPPLPPEPPIQPPTQQPAQRSWRERVRMLAARLPTPWLLTGLGAVLLGASAVFGGLDDAPVQAAPVIMPGVSHAGSELTVTVKQALMIDALPEQFLTPDEGNRLLVVRAIVENVTTEPIRLSIVEADSIRVTGVNGLAPADPPTDIFVIDDGSDKVVVQPGVPVEVAFVWEVGGDALAAGDSIEVQLLDRVLISEGELTYGGLYADPVVRATLELVVDDVGAGVSE